MKRFAAYLIALLPLVAQAQLTVEGSPSVEVTPDASTGLKKIFVVKDASQARLTYRASSSSSVTVERFSSLGGGYAEPVAAERDGNAYTVAAEPNMGYIFTDGTTQTCCWIADYASAPYGITDIIPAENDCDRLALNLVGTAPELTYYTVNGRRMTLDREILLTYNTLRYDADSQQYVTDAASVSLAYAGATVGVPAPLCSTSVTIHPGRFASAFGEGVETESQWVEPVAVAATVSAVQAERDADNEQTMGDGGEALGGSAPAEVTFSAAVTDAAIFRRWEFSQTPGFEDAQLTFSDLTVAYTFEEAGTTYVRFVCDNASGTCPFESETFTVTIGESRLECPNAFSPGTSEGVNDEWKVSYRSIIEFHCDIFNRWGKKLATLTDPSQGWDGIVGGKPVSSGVYFYVINAVGSDGKKYKLSGDINVISSRRPTTSTGPVDE